MGFGQLNYKQKSDNVNDNELRLIFCLTKNTNLSLLQYVAKSVDYL